jgi:hypothetical protein
MRERLQLLLGEDTDDLPILTLHAFARRLLASQPDRKQHPITIYNPNQAFRVLRRAMADVGLPETVWPPVFVAGLVADAKEQGSRDRQAARASDRRRSRPRTRASARAGCFRRRSFGSRFAVLAR